MIHKVKTFRKGIEVFESKDNFRKWLNTKLITFRGKTPIDMAEKYRNWEIVYDALGRMEHGICS